MEPTVADAVRRLTPENRVDADAFRTFVHENRRSLRLIPVEAGRRGHDVMRSYANAHLADRFAASYGFRDVPLLKQAGTGVCASVLGRPVREPHVSHYPHEVVSAVLNDAESTRPTWQPASPTRP